MKTITATANAFLDWNHISCAPHLPFPLHVFIHANQAHSVFTMKCKTSACFSTWNPVWNKLDRRSDWRCWAFYLRGAVPMNPAETLTPSEGKDRAYYSQKSTSNTVVQENKRSWSVRTHCVRINSVVCNKPFDTLCIESLAQNNPETRYSELNITFQRLVQWKASSGRSCFDELMIPLTLNSTDKELLTVFLCAAQKDGFLLRRLLVKAETLHVFSPGHLQGLTSADKPLLFL